MPPDDAIAQLNSSLAGRYTVEREIGAGGMATVYLARDVRHNRRVALKVLKPELGAMLGVERFLAEIQVTANLQHPNLLPLFDSGEAGGLLFYVMPYMEGESLRARLDREQQLPVDEAVHIAVAVAGALAYAHVHGVIHRDLKPENILMQAGQPVIADFGIALAVSKAGGTRLTQTGLSLGTPQYMSPEQALGDRPVDGRADIYSLGAVTYEMLAGEPPHTGPSSQAIMAKLMTEEVRPLTTLRPSVPGHVDAAVRHALEKLPADRFATAHEFADALLGKTTPLPATRGATSAATRPQASGAERTRLRDPLVAALALAALTAVAFGAWAWTRPLGNGASSASRFIFTLPKDQRIVDGVPGGTLAISPDGRTIAFVSPTPAHTFGLYLRPIDQVAAVQLAGTDDARNPCFSPDGRWIAFTVGPAVKKMPVDGSPVATLATLSTVVLGLSWGIQSQIVAGSNGGLHVVPASGGTARLAVARNSAGADAGQLWPLALPDGKTVLFMLAGAAVSGSGSRLGIASLETGRARLLEVEGVHPVGVLNGEFIFVSLKGSVLAARFSAREGTASGTQFPLVEDVLVDNVGGGARVALSATGTLVYLSGGSQTQPLVVDARGAATPLISEARGYAAPRFSPDGRRAAFAVNSLQGNDIWVYDLTKSTFTRLTSDGANRRPEWSEDGKRILFVSERPGSAGVWWVPADGGAAPTLLYKPNETLSEAVLSRDGAWLLYRTGGLGAQHQLNIFAVPLRGDRTPVPLVTGSYRAMAPRLSPDGRWLAFASDESGRFEIYVQPFPGPGARVQLSSDGGSAPLWARSGKTLYYQHTNEVVALPVTTDQAFSIGERKVVFTGDYVSAFTHASYDVAPDGTHFIMLKRADEDARAMIVLNWDRELEAKRKAQGAR